MNSASLPFPLTPPGAGGAAAAADFPAEPWPLALGGIPFDNIGAATALAAVETMVASRRSHFIVLANASLLHTALRGPRLRAQLATADLVLSDSWLLTTLSHGFGNPLRYRVAAADLAGGILQLAAARSYRVFLAGVTEPPVAALARTLPGQFPGIAISGFAALPGTAADLPAMLERVRASRSDVVLAHADAARDPLLAENARQFGAPVVIRLSRPLERLVRTKPAAPAPAAPSGRTFASRARLAWGQGVGRAVVLWALLRDGWSMSHRAPPQLPPPRVIDANPDWLHVEAGADLVYPVLQAHARFWAEIRSQPADCALEGAHVRRIDATGLAFLARWQSRLRRNGRQLFLIQPSDVLRRALDRSGLAPALPIADDAPRIRTRLAVARPATPPLQTGMIRSLAWCGEIIAANVDDVWHMTADYVRTFTAAGATLVIIDLGRLRALDEAGAALMVRVKQRAREFRTEVLFAHVPPAIEAVLRRAAVAALVLEGGQ